MRLADGMDGGRAGFTLLELMVVCVLIGIMTAMILPEMKGTYEEALLRSNARKLISVFQLASSRAIATRELHRVRLDPKEHRYRLERMARPGEMEKGYVAARDAVGGDGTLDSRITVELRGSRTADEDEDSGELASAAGWAEEQDPEETGGIGFYPDGTADGCDVVLRDRQGFSLVLRVNAVTARVQLLDLGHE
jgi:type II secretion system protein H